MSFMNIESFKQAINLCDGVKALALKIDEKQNTVSMWMQRKSIPSEKLIPIARATDWKVTPHALDSVVYPHPTDGLPEHLRGVS